MYLGDTWYIYFIFYLALFVLGIKAIFLIIMHVKAFKKMKINKMKRSKIVLSMMASLGASNIVADPVIWVQEVNGGEVRFYDWGYSGPDGRTANDFESINGFNGASQIQHVVTVAPDRLTPDDPALIKTDLGTLPLYREANMDGQTQFYGWGYTSPAGSTFSNMQIDADGDYFIAREDMAFNYYGEFDYQYEGAADINTLFNNGTEGINQTNIGFQPYALSDAKGWCGSALASNPSALEAMAGQVTFDFGFEAFLPTTFAGDNGVFDPGEGSMQIVQDFQMRSYGSLEVDISTAEGGVGNFLFNSDAVVNNTNPLDSTIQTDSNGNSIMVEAAVLNMDGTPALDANGDPRTELVPLKQVGGGGSDIDYYNEVSFMGGGVVPGGVWVSVVDPSKVLITDSDIIEVLDADDGDANTIWWANSFAGYPFLLRADGLRIVDALDMNLYSDYCGIPGAVCDAEGNFIGADASAPGSAFNVNGELINLEGAVIQNLSAVPIPAAVWLFGSGLLGLIGIARRKELS